MGFTNFFLCKAITRQKAKKGPQRKNVRAITIKPLTMSYASQIYKYLIKFIFLIKLIKLILCKNTQHGKKYFPRFGF